MLVSSFNLSQSFNYAICKKRFKSEINCFCIWALYSDMMICKNFTVNDFRLHSMLMNKVGLIGLVSSVEKDEKVLL
jgi:hypothetical protein